MENTLTDDELSLIYNTLWNTTVDERTRNIMLKITKLRGLE